MGIYALKITNMVQNAILIALHNKVTQLATTLAIQQMDRRYAMPIGMEITAPNFVNQHDKTKLATANVTPKQVQI